MINALKGLRSKEIVIVERYISQLVDQFVDGRITRRGLVQSIAAAVSLGGAAARAAQPSSAGAGGKPFKVLDVNHISYQVKDYRKTRDFYSKVLGMTVSHDDGKQQCYLGFGHTLLIARNADAGGHTPTVDHMCYTLADYGTTEADLATKGQSVFDRLKAFGLDPKPDTRLSWFVEDPDGYKVQLASSLMRPGVPVFEQVIKEASQSK